MEMAHRNRRHAVFYSVVFIKWHSVLFGNPRLFSVPGVCHISIYLEHDTGTVVSRRARSLPVLRQARRYISRVKSDPAS